MLEGEPRQGTGYEGIDQFMFRPHSNTQRGDIIGSADAYHPIAQPTQGATGKPAADSADFISRMVERFSASEQRVLGIAALLGKEVSVHEVARIATTSPHEVAVIFARAIPLEILHELRGDRFTFVDEQKLNAAGALLGPYESLTAHARAAKLLTGMAPERVLRRVSHAFTAARRSTADAITAIAIAREAALVLQAADDVGQAATLLSRAIELHDAAALPGPFAALVVEHAEAVLACGLLAEARPLFHRAAQLAEVEGDPHILARAALGLGGVWVREHRLTEEAERVSALQQRALAMLPSDASVLCARLSVRLAAEQVYRGGPVAAVADAVDIARRTGDARALAEALSLYHHALLTPEYSNSRLAVANELLITASIAHDKLLSLMGLCWRAADLFLLADPSATIALTELRLRAEALHCRGVLFIVQAMDVMLAIRAGQFEQAEQAATTCYAFGTEAGDADALAYYGAHLAAIRLFQGREAELADVAASLAASPVVTERDQAFATAAALFSLRRGDAHPARAILQRLRRDGLESIVPTSSWLLTIQGVIDIAAELQDTEIAQSAYEALLPYAELPIMASLAVVCFGSAHRPLAVAAMVCGKPDIAIEHWNAAVAANERLGHRPAAIQARAELALALIRRASDDDRQRGHTILQQALTEAEALGMHGLVTRWQNALVTTQKAWCNTAQLLATISQTPQGGWRVALGHQIATVPDLVGLRYLAQLLAAPNQEVSAVTLVIEHGTPSFATNKQEVVDKQTITALHERIRELREQSILTSRIQDELDALTHELAYVTGLSGRARTFADIPERARTAVRKAVKRAIEQITTANPVVGQHLAVHIETGTVCRYRREGSHEAQDRLRNI